MYKQNSFRWSMLIFFAIATFEMSQADELDKTQVIDMSSPVVATVGELDFRECMVSVQGRDRKVQCAWFEVAENPQAESGKKIKLFVVRLPSKRKSKNIDDPMLFIAGGPGQAASETYLFADYTWSGLAKYRDFYLIDQRGTGYSNNLGCQQIVEKMNSSAKEYDSEETKGLVRECLDKMPGDVRYYTTDISVGDFEQVRQALQVNNWNLLGVSYGTRVATHYMRKYPKAIRTVVLDSVVPPQHILGSEIAMRSQNSLNTLYERCEKDKACKEHLPNLKQEVAALFERLKAKPVEIKVENFRTGEIEDTVFTRDDLVILVRLYLYSPNSMAILPPMLHEAAVNNNFSPLARAATSTVESMSHSMSTGLHNSVMCTEEYPYYDFSEDQIQANTESYMGMDVVNIMKDICAIWPKGADASTMKEPLASDIPTLLLSGEFDPITPPDYAEDALATLSNGKHIVLAGQGHFVSGVGCMPNLIEKFVNDMSSEWLGMRCLERVSASPLFINFNGTAP